ncbi:MAG: IgGFc-binding protein [Kofleriaceae bacterium]
MCLVLLAACGPGARSGGDDVGGDDGGGGDDATTWDGDPVSCFHAAQTNTYVGCDFYPTVHPNVVKAYMDFAVVVANASPQIARVVIERNGTVITMGDVMPNNAGTFYLPWVNELKHWAALCDTDIANQPGPLNATKYVDQGAFHLTSSVPVTVYQFNPLEYKGVGGPPGKSWAGCSSCFPGCNSYTNDASLLLPSTALTGSYVVSAQAGIDTPDLRSPGYVTVTGLHDGTVVDVRVGPRGVIQPGAGVTGGGPNAGFSFTVDRGDVVLLPGTPATDLGGTLVRGTQPVQVMTGNPCIHLPHDRQACDHIEETVLPVETLGKHYVVARPTGPRGTAAQQFVRLFGVVDGTNLSYVGTQPPGAPSTLMRGQVVDLGMMSSDFEVTSDLPFQIATYQVGNTIVDPSLAGKGDPSQSTVAAVEQFRKKYVFLAPNDYDVSFADVIAPPNTTIMLDGVLVTAPATPIGNHVSIRIPLPMGTAGGQHVIEASAEVGLQVSGYGFATSYQYPGGLNLKNIAPPLDPIL